MSFLPIGSVVSLKNTKKRLMVTGFYVKSDEKDVYFDYLGCIYPEGMVSEHDNYVFNNEQIEKVVYSGFIDEEETNFKKMLDKIINKQNGTKQDVVISIPLDYYKQYNVQEEDIISIPIDQYNEYNQSIICIPADLYKAACTIENDAISIPLDLYRKQQEIKLGARLIDISVYSSKIVDNSEEVISIPFETYKQANGIIKLPYKKYKKMLNKKSVIKINAKIYEELLNKKNNNDSSQMISIPLDVYKRLQEEEKKEDIISIPINAYEKMINCGQDKGIISIPLEEYKKVTKGYERDGIISLPSNIYNDILKKEKSDIDDKKNEIIEIPFDLYSQTVLDNN